MRYVDNLHLMSRCLTSAISAKNFSRYLWEMKRGEIVKSYEDIVLYSFSILHVFSTQRTHSKRNSQRDFFWSRMRKRDKKIKKEKEV